MRWILVLGIAAIMACGAEPEDEDPQEWWEVDPLSPPESFEPYEYEADCRSTSFEFYNENETSLALVDPRPDHPSCVRPGDGYGGNAEYCDEVGASRSYYENACSNRPSFGGVLCVWTTMHVVVDGLCRSDWLCIPEERAHERGVDKTWEQILEDSC